MSIQHPDRVDFISLKDSHVYLTISDHLNWNNVNDHILLLQSKVNAYLNFCQSGEIYEKFPQYEGKKILIQLNGKYSLPEAGRIFLEQTNEVLNLLEIKLLFDHIPDI